MKHKFKVGLLAQVILSILLGILCGSFFPAPLVRVFLTFNGIFSQFLGFIIPLIILGLVTVAIADIGKTAGRMVLITVLIAYGSTVFAGLLSYFTGTAVFPSMIDSRTVYTTPEDAVKLTEFFVIEIPPALGVMTALVLSFVLGLGLAAIRSEHLKQVARDFKDIIEMTISSVIIRVLPLYIFGIFLNMSYIGEVAVILNVFVKIIVVIFIIHIFLLLLQYGVAGAIVRKNPLVLLKNMMPAYFTALGTQSSAATIPVTLERTMKNGVTGDVARFVVPLCATIHLAGSTLKIVACALAIMIMNGMPYDVWLFLGFILMLGITMVAAPGVPGGAIMASLGVLHSILGFGTEMQALMIALYIAMDSFGTACNVTGDGAIALVVDRISEKDKKNAGRENVPESIPEEVRPSTK